MSPTPLVSILLPAHDAVAMLAGCLRSLSRQSEPRWECVLVDDGSTDGTAALARRLAAADPRVRLLELEHRGLVPALHAGLELCRGRFVARMDVDDLMHRHRLRDQLARLEADDGLAGLGCHVRLFPRFALGPGMRAYERWLNRVDSPEALEREVWIECPVAHPTLMLDRRLLVATGYRDLGWPEDYDLVLRLLAAGHRLDVVPRRLLLWREHAGRLSRRSAVYATERFTACKAAYLGEGFLRGAERYVLWGYGSTGRELRRALALHDKRAAFVVDVHPGRMSQRIHGAEVVPPERLDALPRLPLLVSVAGERPRAEIREFLRRLGRVETRDYLCVA